MKRVGPELKMPDLKNLKVPAVMADVYYDLRDRRLLPLIALVLVAIAAVPFLLRSETEEPLPPTPDVAVEAAGTTAGASSLTVVEATPELRDYRKRLDARTPTDPFRQQFTEPVGDSSTASTASGDDGGASTSTSPSPIEGPTGTAPEPVSPTGGGSGGSGGSSEGDPGSARDQDFRWFKFVADIQISKSETAEDGSVSMGEVEPRHAVKPLTALPGPKTPVVTFMGPNVETERAIFAVSKDVGAITGSKICVTGVDRCELLEVKAGYPLVFEYGPNRVRYKLKVIGFDLVRVDAPPVAG